MIPRRRPRPADLFRGPASTDEPRPARRLGPDAVAPLAVMLDRLRRRLAGTAPEWDRAVGRLAEAEGEEAPR
jgi:hypothetical protein